jgi:hypothetical protein
MIFAQNMPKIIDNISKINEPDEKIEIPLSEDFVFSEMGYSSYNNSDFELLTESKKLNITYTQPIFIGEYGKKMINNTDIEVKSTIAMGKSAFIEQPITIDNVGYYFVQWKGVGKNSANEKAIEKAEAKEGKIIFPLGQDNSMPFFILEIKGKTLVRFMGGAYYEDLLLESENSKIMEQYGLRIPKIISTIKFSIDFCSKNNLPIPKDNDPNSYAGVSLHEFIAENKDKIEPELYKRIMSSYEVGDYESAILGQNVRAFRNVWRISEIEKVMEETDESTKKEKIYAIFKTSREVFEKEFGNEMDENQFIEMFVSLLGKQVAILLKNNLIHGAMKNHKQDITLAAEICDFDGAYQLSEEYFANEMNKPEWVVNEPTMQEWQQEKQQELYRQILLVGSHIKPIVDAAGQIDIPQDIDKIVNIFVTEILKGLSTESIQSLIEFIGKSEQYQTVNNIAGDDQMTQSNFNDYQKFFDLIVEKLLA